MIKIFSSNLLVSKQRYLTLKIGKHGQIKRKAIIPRHYVWRVNNCQKRRNLPISNPNPKLHKISAHTKCGENPLKISQVIVQERKYGRRTDDSRTDGRAHERSTSNHNTQPLSCGGVYKKPWCHKRATKAQISMHSHTLRSGALLPADRIEFNCRKKPNWECSAQTVEISWSKHLLFGYNKSNFFSGCASIENVVSWS